MSFARTNTCHICAGLIVLLAPLSLFAAAATPPLALTPPPAGAPKPIERQLDFQMSISGSQSWKNELQTSEATTTQDYEISTRLRSNGFLYSDNLLETDQQARIEIKQQYYARQGLQRLKAENGGKLPAAIEDVDKLSERYRENSLCKDDFECNSKSIERIAALNALKANNTQALEEFLASPGMGEEARYLYFFGYAGCPVHIHVTYNVQVNGMRAFDKEHKKLVPYALERKADTQGNEIDRKGLCEKYVVTYDVKTGTMFVENLFIPSPPGVSVQTIAGSPTRNELDLPPPAQVLDWTSAKLRQAKDSGSEKVAMPFTSPVDGDWTPGGQFNGTLNLSLTWGFKPVAAVSNK